MDLNNPTMSLTPKRSELFSPVDSHRFLQTTMFSSKETHWMSAATASSHSMLMMDDPSIRNLVPNSTMS